VFSIGEVKMLKSLFCKVTAETVQCNTKKMDKNNKTLENPKKSVFGLWGKQKCSELKK
jgi:hypothetical protein